MKDEIGHIIGYQTSDSAVFYILALSHQQLLRLPQHTYKIYFISSYQRTF